MRAVPALSTRIVAVLVLVLGLACVAWAPGGSAGVPDCGSLKSQAVAQELFVDMGGRPGHGVAALDSDADGVACEERPGPYEGFATIGYNRAKRFFYGVAAMPAAKSGEDDFACLRGNRHYAEGPRLLRVYRALPGADRPVSRDLGTEADSDRGRLFWKLDRERVPPGRYYAAFEEKARTSPYAPSECPGFSSQPTLLPRPRR